jgi:histidine triad (HIT) family protein
MTCLFCQIVEKKLSTPLVFEDEKIVAFNDISPQAPVHLLIIPKIHISALNELENNHKELLGHMILSANQLAHQHECDKNGYRLVWNCNADGGQTVFHIHLHLLGGRAMHWPPG